MPQPTVQLADGYLNRTPIFQFILLPCLFPLWGCAASLNDILITQFKSVFALNDFASALVQSAFYGDYFLIAIPASLVIRSCSNKRRFRRGVLAQFLYVGLQVAVWSFTIRLALMLGADNERHASNFIIYSFIGFFINKFIANCLMTRCNVQKVLIAYSVIGVAMLAYVMLVPNFSAVYAAVGVSALFGPCWATIYTGTLKTVENRYTEVAGAVIVTSIVGAAIVPALQGYVSDYLGSMQRSFGVSLLCFAFVGYNFWGALRHQERRCTALPAAA